MTEAGQSGDSPPLDSGLRCPGCGYNLTGLIENRCPECGGEFDRDRLLALLESGPRPIPVWDDKDSHVLVRFARVCLITWFAPGRFGRAFPRRFDPKSAGRFRLMVVPVAAVPLAINYVVKGGLSHLIWLVPSIMTLLIGVAACERILGRLYNAHLLPDSPDKPVLVKGDASDSWLGLVGMFRGFVILTMTAAVVTEGMAPVTADYSHIGALVVVLWWWICLGRSMSVQPVAAYQRVFAVFLIPVIAIVSIIICATSGIFLSALFGM